MKKLKITMFEGVVASLLNRYLGKYVEDLDLESLNVGIFSGNVVLENLKLKPEALYELGLPIFVRVGTVGKLSLNIPWNRLCNQTAVVTIEEVFVLAVPITTGKFEPELEKKLLRAEKKRILNKLDPNGTLSSESPDNFTETLVAAILKNLRIYIYNVHIRYEDEFTNSNLPVSLGVCMHSLTVENTNSKWKPISHSSKMGSIYQVVKIESLSMYCNANCNKMFLKKKEFFSGSKSRWINSMKQSLEIFSVLGEAFDFVLKPISVRLKIIVNKSNEAHILKILTDFVLQDAALQLSHQQYLALVQLSKSVNRISVNRLFRKFRPDVPLSRNAKKWWIYVYESIVDNKIRPYTWSRLFAHRSNYRSYCQLYEKMLLDPSNSEIKIDLQQIEDTLDITNVIIAREQTKLRLREKFSDKIIVKELPFHSWFGVSSETNSKKLKLCIDDKKNSFWNQLSETEKNHLHEMIGFVGQSDDDITKQYTEHKFNITIANFNISLISSGRETLVIAISHLLSSIETRPAAKAYKISARIESLLIEGASVEYSLLPIITSENILNGNQHHNFLVIDFEKNPVNSEVDYLLSVSAESLEIIYHEFSVSALSSFLQTPTLSLESAVLSVIKKGQILIKETASSSLSRRPIIQINVDIKLPHFIIPEFGSLQKCGNVLVLDMGHLKIWSDLQLSGLCLEEVTQLELEEKLYDRFYFSLMNFQIHIFSPEENWRQFKKVHSGQYHILSEIHCQVVFSNSIKPENKQLPRYKLNVSLQELKLKMSDSRIINLLNFFNNLPRPKSHTIMDTVEDVFLFEHLEADLDNLDNLEIIQHTITYAEVTNRLKKSSLSQEERRKTSLLTIDGKSALSSEISDEDSEVWAQILDLPGFDDNVSQNNVVLYLFRIHIAQIIVELKRSSHNVDKPYLIMRAVNFCFDISFMEYGPAIQISLSSLNILDKLHGSASSKHIHLFSTEGKPDVLTILYRKVKSDCPDFKSHFYSVEQSLVIEVNTLHFILHREAMIDAYRYLQYCCDKFKNKYFEIINLYAQNSLKRLYRFWFKSSDPPIPSGATKFSYSVRVPEVKIQLSDTEIDFLLAKINGFELDYAFKANERFVFRVYLRSLSIDDISNTSLYPKIFSVEEEKFFEMKHVRRTPRFERQMNIESNISDITSSDNFKLYLGRVHFVLMYKLIYDTKKFFTPFVPAESVNNVSNWFKCILSRLVSNLRFRADKIHVSVECQLPTLLLPHQASSPNLIICNIGDLTAENFFQESVVGENRCRTFSITDNTLITLAAVSIARAIVNMNGSIIVQETIMDPVCCKVDLKRLLIDERTIIDFDSPIFNINCTIDKILINLGQKDFGTLYFTWSYNLKKILSLCHIHENEKSSALLPEREEAKVRQLEAFFNQADSKRIELILHINFEGLNLCLYSDLDEVLSSPVRDENRSLCKCAVGETVARGLYHANGKCESQISFQSVLLEDTRITSKSSIKRIFQSYGATNCRSNNENVCITVPPVMCIDWNGNQYGECRCDILIDHIRLNLSVSFLIDLFRFFVEAVSYGQDDLVNSNTVGVKTFNTAVTNSSGLVNYGYVGESIDTGSSSVQYEENVKADYSNSMNIGTEDAGGLTLSVICRKPEIMFFSSMDENSKSHALLLRSDISFEYIRQVSNVSFLCHVNDLHMLSKLQSSLIKTTSNVVLQPCNVEISKNWNAVNKEMKFFVTCNKIDVHISGSTIHTILNIIRELDSYLYAEIPLKKSDSSENIYQDVNDLWTAKRITPFFFPQTHENVILHDQHKQQKKQVTSNVLPESAIISLPVISIMFEIEDIVQKKPVLILKMHAETKLKNWSTSLEMKGDVGIQCSYYNYAVDAWEPVIEPLVKSNNNYCPWEISIKVFTSKSYPISTILNRGSKNEHHPKSKKKTSISSVAKTSVKSEIRVESETSADENMELNHVDKLKVSKKKIHRSSSQFTLYAGRNISSFSDTGSDSENEDTVMEKLKYKFGQLLTGESSDECIESSDSNTSMDEQSLDDDTNYVTDDDTVSYTTDNSFLINKGAVFITKQRESGANSCLDSDFHNKSAVYIILDTREHFNLAITPYTISVFKQILDSFSLKFNNILVDTQFLSLRNDIAPHSTVLLSARTAQHGPMKILMCAGYSLDTSSPSSHNSTTASTPCNLDNVSDFEFNSGIESFEGGFAPDAYSKMDNAKRKFDSDLFFNALQFPLMPVDSLYNKITDRQLQISVPGFENLNVICPTRSNNKYHLLQPVKNNTRYYIIISVQNDLWGQSIVVRSPLQVKNETCYALGLYYKKNAIETLDFDHIGELTNPFEDAYKFAIVQPDEVYNIPITITYHCSIYVLPLYNDYQLSETGLWWRELVNNISCAKNIICKPKEGKSSMFVVRAVTVRGIQLLNPYGSTLPNYMIRLLPSVIIYNLLPCAFHVNIPSANFNVRIEAGGKSSVYSIDMSSRHTVCLEVPIYFGLMWTGNFNLCSKLEEKLITMTTEQDTDGGNKHLLLNVNVDKSESQSITIYSPYWIVNKTGLPIQLKGSSSDIVYETVVEEPLFFTFRKSQKRTVRLRIYQSSWSSSFSIDTVGCSRRVTCRDRERNRNYNVLVEISVSRLSPQSTKIITLIPYFLLLNQCKMLIRFMEENEQADLWIDLPQNQTTPFWPETNSKKMCIKLKDSSLVSQHFFVNRTCRSVLRMDRGTAIVVDIVGDDNRPFLIVFKNYKPGDAPVRIDNYCDDLFLKICQEGLGQVTLLSPYQSLLYTWDDPTGERKLLWNVYSRKNENFTANFVTDGYGQEFVSFKLVQKQSLRDTVFKSSKLTSSFKKFAAKYNSDRNSSSAEESEGENDIEIAQIKTREGKIIVYWVSYLEGLQRVLLFTQDERIAYYTYSKIDSEKSNMELFLSIKGIGLSLVMDYDNKSRELAYISLTDSASIWEVSIAHSWKILPLELATWIEHQWRNGVKRAQLKDYVNVDLEKMKLIKPFFGELRRSYYPAIWIHCRKSFDYYYLQCKIHKLQIDNQLPNSIFESILYPKVVSYDIIRKYGLKPFIEITILKKRDADYEKNVYKYIKLAILEFCVQLDTQFLLSGYELLQPLFHVESPSLKIRADICTVHHPLTMKFNNYCKYEKRTIIEYLYVSPIKIQLTFSAQSMPKLNYCDVYDKSYVRACLYFIFSYVSTSIGYIADYRVVKLECSNFEEFGIETEMISKVKQIRHSYFQNLLQQVYTRLLSVDSSNRINLDIDLCDEYVDLYYDLSLVFLKKVDEFATAINDDARCLLSHITCTSANSTSSLIMCGKRTSLDLGLNSELMKKKTVKQQMSFEEPEEVLISNQCFEIGVLHGLSGVQVNSIAGIQQNGIELFFRTVGKHLLRLLSKYSNTIHNVSVAAIDGVHRAAETGTNIIYRKRSPKNISSFGMKPFSVHQSIGLNILYSLNKGIYSETDDYVTHVVLTPDGKSCLLLTLQRIFFINKCNIWDEWKIEWCINVNDIIEVPSVVNNKLIFKIRQEECIQDFGGEDKQIQYSDVGVLFWIQKMIEVIFIINLENKPSHFVESKQ